MSERSKLLMEKIWVARNSGADTEEKLISATLRIVSDSLNNYGTQNGMIVLDRNDILSLADELEQ
jgi:hypothetical protein